MVLALQTPTDNLRIHVLYTHKELVKYWVCVNFIKYTWNYKYHLYVNIRKEFEGIKNYKYINISWKIDFTVSAVHCEMF